MDKLSVLELIDMIFIIPLLVFLLLIFNMILRCLRNQQPATVKKIYVSTNDKSIHWGTKKGFIRNFNSTRIMFLKFSVKGTALYLHRNFNLVYFRLSLILFLKLSFSPTKKQIKSESELKH